MSRIFSLILGLALIAVSAPVAAQQLPRSAIRIVVPFSPAGFPDRIARVLASEWSATLGQRVYVENKPGAAGIIGTAEAARAEPDGTTLVISSMPTLVLAPLINPRSDFRPIEDLRHIIYIGGPPNSFVVASRSRIRSFADLLQIAKEAPQSYGTAGVGTVGHLTAAYVGHKAHLKLTHVPYNGPMLGDILSGILDFGSLTAPTVMGGIDAGELRAIVVGTDKRLAKYPEIPTFSELGFDISPISWMAVSAPAGISQELQSGLSKQFSEILTRPRVKAILQQELIEPIAMSAEELTAFVHREIDAWAPIVNAVGLRK
jgi:tripartite-type tricarboxylate transporter receptor subunit TctC